MQFFRNLAFSVPATTLFLGYLAVSKLLVLAVSTLIHVVQNLPPSALPKDDTTNWILGIILVFGFGSVAIPFYYLVTAMSHFALYILPGTALFDIILRKKPAIYYLFPPILVVGAIAWSPVLRTWGAL